MPENERYRHYDLGYAKIGNKWGIALRDVSGDYNDPDYEQCDSWLFNDAPRWMRVEGIEKIPDLLDELIKRTQDTTKKIRSKTAEAKQFADMIAKAAGTSSAKTSR